MPKRIGNPQFRRTHFIKDWREGRDITQQRLADLVGRRMKDPTTKTSISRIESGETGYTQDSLEAIADALGTHPATLLTRPPLPQELAATPPQKAAGGKKR